MNQRLQKYHQQIRNAWYSDYLQCLQLRQKIFQDRIPIALGELVLLSEDNVEPGKWPLSRVIELIPGKNGIVRVVKVKNKSSRYLRPIIKYSPFHFHS
jgi:hypothetical protein